MRFDARLRRLERNRSEQAARPDRVRRASPYSAAVRELNARLEAELGELRSRGPAIYAWAKDPRTTELALRLDREIVRIEARHRLPPLKGALPLWTKTLAGLRALPRRWNGEEAPEWEEILAAPLGEEGV
ncbi:MAG: hypothetical protein D6731_18760 [Planctomycetota bacterium]|nr:MAG: hypothetical protein D6731_18760 [Planctomycetota bacterium]